MLDKANKHKAFLKPVGNDHFEFKFDSVALGLLVALFGVVIAGISIWLFQLGGGFGQWNSVIVHTPATPAYDSSELREEYNKLVEESRNLGIETKPLTPIPDSPHIKARPAQTYMNWPHLSTLLLMHAVIVIGLGLILLGIYVMSRGTRVVFKGNIVELIRTSLCHRSSRQFKIEELKLIVHPGVYLAKYEDWDGWMLTLHLPQPLVLLIACDGNFDKVSFNAEELIGKTGLFYQESDIPVIYNWFRRLRLTNHI